MYNDTNCPPAEYRVRTVVRYIVTRYCHPYTETRNDPPLQIEGGSRAIAEFHREQDAFDVATALAKVENAVVNV